MDVIEKFDRLIKSEANRFRKTVAFDYNTFLNKFYMKPIFDITISFIIDNKDYQFCDANEACELLEDYKVKNIDIYVTYSPVYFLDTITNIIYESLTNQENFTDEEVRIIIERISDDYYDSFSEIELEEECQNIVDLIENNDLECQLEMFYNDEEYSSAVLGAYCEQIICENELSLNKTQLTLSSPFIDTGKILMVENLNNHLRNIFMKMVDDLEDMNFSEEEIIDIFANYLHYPISLKIINKHLYNYYLENEEQEKYFKRYSIGLIIYDFYNVSSLLKDLNNDALEELSYINFIEQNSLEDILQLFFHDQNFCKCVLKYYILYNSFGSNYKENKNSEVTRKFVPISTIDKLFSKN